MTCIIQYPNLCVGFAQYEGNNHILINTEFYISARRDSILYPALGTGIDNIMEKKLVILYNFNFKDN